jgi:hypothetical protein
MGAWIAANPETAIGLGYLLINLLNAILRPGKGWSGGTLARARLMLDRLSIVQAGSRKRPMAKTETE